MPHLWVRTNHSDLINLEYIVTLIDVGEQECRASRSRDGNKWSPVHDILTELSDVDEIGFRLLYLRQI